jgi:indole-3-glycerol phosphate synthase
VELGLDAIVEVHTADELAIASGIGADIIGVNNRNLSTFDVSLDVSRLLISQRPPNTFMIAESGISNRDEIDEMRTLGFEGFLIGESLMRSEDAGGILGGWI